MEKQFIEHWEFESLIVKAIKSYIDKYRLEFSKTNSNGTHLINDIITISISDRAGDFSVGVSNGLNYVTINELVFSKYPDYIEMMKNGKIIGPFKLKINDFNLYNEYFMYLVKTSFDFIEENFPQVFKGKF